MSASCGCCRSCTYECRYVPPLWSSSAYPLPPSTKGSMLVIRFRRKKPAPIRRDAISISQSVSAVCRSPRWVDWSVYMAESAPCSESLHAPTGAPIADMSCCCANSRPPVAERATASANARLNATEPDTMPSQVRIRNSEGYCLRICPRISPPGMAVVWMLA